MQMSCYKSPTRTLILEQPVLSGPVYTIKETKHSISLSFPPGSPMSPVLPLGKSGFAMEEDEFYAIKGDRKTRKPLVEKKRRARINESLHELRTLLAETDLQSKMENAEVLELTVKRVENILQNRSQEAETMNHEASERFAAGYIQCMHEVHTFVSTCPGIDATVAAELLNHLLECMPLNEDHFQDMIVDLLSESSASSGSWAAETQSPGDCSVSSVLSPSPSNPSSEDLCSDLEETEIEGSPASADDSLNSSNIMHSKFMWRPW